MRIALLIPAGGAASHDRNAEAQLATNFAQIPPGFIVSRVWSSDPDSSIVDDGVDLYIPGIEGYFEILRKSLAAIRYVSEKHNPDFIIRGNSSNYFQFAAIFDLLEPLNPSLDFYGGSIGEISADITPLNLALKYVGGSGIYLSRKTYLRLMKMDSELYENVVDDVAIGHFLRDAGVRFTPVSRNDVTDYEPVQFAPQSRIKCHSSDALTVKRFEAVAKVLNTPGRLKRNLLQLLFVGTEIQFLAQQLNFRAILRLFRKFRFIS